MMFENQLAEMPEAKEIPLVDLEQKDLEGLYRSAVGVDPTYRAFSREVLIAGIEKPGEEQARLAQIDLEDDQAERRNRK